MCPFLSLGRSVQERITSTNKGSITSVQAVYVPADDLTDPAPATTFAHLDATTVRTTNINGIDTMYADTLDTSELQHTPDLLGRPVECVGFLFYAYFCDFFDAQAAMNSYLPGVEWHTNAFFVSRHSRINVTRVCYVRYT